MKIISRRDFIKISSAGIGALLLLKTKIASGYLPEFPAGERLGRLFATHKIMSKPDVASTEVKTLYENNVINLYREVIGTIDSRGFRTKTWYETDGGYIYSANVQPVKNLPNQPVTSLPVFETEPGFWAEVTVPYVDLIMDGEIPRSPLLKDILANNQTPKLYFGQVIWVDNLSTGDYGKTLYHVKEKYGDYGDQFWADGRAFKLITPEEVSPIDPDLTEKRIVVDVTRQTLSCYVGNQEIFYTTVSTGAKNTFGGEIVDIWSTPIGDNHVVNRKYISLHMAGGADNKATGGWEEFAVPYTSIFAAGGISFHSTYWHNAWGNGMSHGCVNMKPDEAKFIYRWTQPGTPYTEGWYEQQSYDGTKVKVVE